MLRATQATLRWLARSSSGRPARARRGARRAARRVPAIWPTSSSIDHPAHRLDRLADGGQRRLGAVHEGGVVEADDRDVAGHAQARPAGPPGSRPSAIGSLAQTMPGDAPVEQRDGRGLARPRASRARGRRRRRRGVEPGRRGDRLARAASLRRDGMWSRGPGAGRSACGRARRGGPSPARWRPRRRTTTRGKRQAVDAALTRTVGRLRSAAAGSAVRRRRPARTARRRRRPPTPAAAGAGRRSPPPRRRRRSGCTGPGCSPAGRAPRRRPRAKAGKIGFWSSGRTSPTSRARSPRSLVGRS